MATNTNKKKRITTADKRLKQSKAAYSRNKLTKSKIKIATKEFEIALQDGKDTLPVISKVHSSIDKARKKGVISDNKADRLKSKISHKDNSSK